MTLISAYIDLFIRREKSGWKCPGEKCTDTLERVNKISKLFQSKDVDILGSMDLLESLKAYLDEIRDKFGEYELKTRDRCPDSDYSFANKQIYDSPEEIGR